MVNVKSVKLKRFVVVVAAHDLTVRLCRLNSLDLLINVEQLWRHVAQLVISCGLHYMTDESEQFCVRILLIRLTHEQASQSDGS